MMWFKQSVHLIAHLPSLHRTVFRGLAFILLAGICAGCSLSFAADVTPPPSLVTPVPMEKPVSTAVSSFPLLLPNLENGENIYSDRCASCHGVDGLGDGTQAGQLRNPAAALGNPEIAMKRKPVEWFEVVTNGNLDRSMPDFKSELSDRQRWDVVAYLYTLGYPQDSLAEGAQVYRQECELCHGRGAGDGTAAIEMGLQQPDWLDPSRLVQYSASDLISVIISGTETGMPAYADRLTMDQIISAAGYVQTYGFAVQDEEAAANAVPAQAAAESTPAAQVSGGQPSQGAVAGTDLITVYGNVANGSGGSRPTNGIITLQGFSGMEQAFTLTTDLQIDGSYRFEGVKLVENPIILTSIEYEGMTFFSEFRPLMDAASGDAVELPILVYDSTPDLSSLTGDRVHIFFNFTQPDLLQVVELFIVSNNGSLAVVPEKPGQPVLRFKLPDEAANLQFQDGILGERYVQTEDGFGDTAAILPGDTPHQVLFAYEMPYNRKKSFSLEFPLDVQAAMVALPDGKVKLKSDQLTDTGQRSIEGTQVRMFTTSDIQKGTQLNLALSGKPGAAGAATASNNNTNLVIGLAALGLSLIAAGVWYIRTHPKASGKEAGGEVAEEDPSDHAQDTVESLLDEIVALDDIYKAGELSEDVYIERRSELKTRLAKLKNSGTGG